MNQNYCEPDPDGDGSLPEAHDRIGPPDNKPLRCEATLASGVPCPCRRYNGRVDLDPEHPEGELCGTPIGVHGICGHRRDQHNAIIT